MQSSASRGLWEGDEIEVVEGALEQQPGFGGVGKFAGARIQVEYYPIRLARILGAALPNVYRNASQVHQRELRFERTTDDVIGFFVFVLNRFRLKTLWRRLLIKAAAAHSIGTAFHGQQTIREVGLQFGKHKLVEAGKVELGVAFVRPKHLIRMRDQFLKRHFASINLISRGLTSSRKPRKTGWRSLRSRVHSL